MNTTTKNRAIRFLATYGLPSLGKMNEALRLAAASSKQAYANVKNIQRRHDKQSNLFQIAADTSRPNAERQDALHRVLYGPWKVTPFDAHALTPAMTLLLQRRLTNSQVSLLQQFDHLPPSSLRLAAGAGRTATVKALLERHTTPAELYDALIAALEHGHLTIADMILDAGAPVNPVPKSTKDPSLIIIFLGFGDSLSTRRSHAFQLFERLVQLGANVNARDRDGHTPLMIAALYRSLPCINLLLSKKADVRARLLDGWSAVYYAIQSGRYDIVRRLVRAGANIRTKTLVNDTESKRVFMTPYEYLKILQRSNPQRYPANIPTERLVLYGRQRH